MSESDALLRTVYIGDHYKPFGEFTVADANAQAQTLKAATGWGTAKVVAVAMGWSELARVMAAAGAQQVSDLQPEEAGRFAERLWVIPPGGSLL